MNRSRSIILLLTSIVFLFVTPFETFAQDCTVNAGVAITWCPGETMTLYGDRKSVV